MTAQPITQNTLFYGDTLILLREHIPSESVDLIYLDPPFIPLRNPLSEKFTPRRLTTE